MNKYDIITLKNLTDIYEQYNLYQGAKGIVANVGSEKSKILFLNEFDVGDYAYLEIQNEDIEIFPKSSKTTQDFKQFMKKNLNGFSPKEKGFNKKEVDAYDEVELLVEDDKYSKFGIHKGDTGIVVDDVMTKSHILVDFGKIDKNNNYSGDCISVNLNDIKILNKNKD